MLALLYMSSVLAKRSNETKHNRTEQACSNFTECEQQAKSRMLGSGLVLVKDLNG